MSGLGVECFYASWTVVDRVARSFRSVLGGACGFLRSIGFRNSRVCNGRALSVTVALETVYECGRQNPASPAKKVLEVGGSVLPVSLQKSRQGIGDGTDGMVPAFALGMAPEDP